MIGQKMARSAALPQRKPCLPLRVLRTCAARVDLLVMVQVIMSALNDKTRTSIQPSSSAGLETSSGGSGASSQPSLAWISPSWSSPRRASTVAAEEGHAEEGGRERRGDGQ